MTAMESLMPLIRKLFITLFLGRKNIYKRGNIQEMTDKIERLLAQVEQFRAQTREQLELFRVQMLGRNGELNALMQEFREVEPGLKREMGQRLNLLKTVAAEKIAALKEMLAEAKPAAAAADDLTRPGSADEIGSRHPISI